MDWIGFGLVVSWLIIISWFDLRKSEIPHSGWVNIPLIAAIISRKFLFRGINDSCFLCQ